MLGPGFKPKSPARLEAAARVEAWTRERFSLGEAVLVSVAEVECRLPGCAPLETVVNFWEAGEQYHFKVFKQLEQVAQGDLPYRWMKEAICLAQGSGCECC